MLVAHIILPDDPLTKLDPTLLQDTHLKPLRDMMNKIPKLALPTVRAQSYPLGIVLNPEKNADCASYSESGSNFAPY